MLLPSVAQSIFKLLEYRANIYLGNYNKEFDNKHIFDISESGKQLRWVKIVSKNCLKRAVMTIALIM